MKNETSFTIFKDNHLKILSQLKIKHEIQALSKKQEIFKSTDFGLVLL